MDIQKIKADKLIPAIYNPRKNLKKGDAEYKKIERSILEFGYVDPLIVNKDMTIIGGHQRYKVLVDLGYDELDCVVVDLPKDREKALNIALNKISGEWDMDALKDVLSGFDEVDQLLTGFDIAELDELFAEPQEVGEDDFDADAAVAAIVEPMTKRGDIWQLGRHRLICGDSTKEEDVEKLMNGVKADMVFTDPPYGMNLDTDYSKMPGTTTCYSKVIGDDKEFDMTKIFEIIKSPIWYIWGADYLYKTIPNFDNGVYIVWSKRMSDEENKVFGSAYELCWTYPKRKKEIWFVRGINQSSERLGVHPTQKPTELCIRALKQNEKAINIVDVFGGSGSTLIACEQLDRICYMMELDPVYCDVIIKRWEEFTGEKAILADG